MRISELSRYAPPGLDLRPQRWTLRFGLACAGLWSLGFVIRCLDARSTLYIYDAINKAHILREDAVMPAFIQLLDDALLGFGILALVMLAFIIWNYVYHKQGSHSIYLMRRVPDRWELHRRCIALPLLAAAICIIAAALLMLIYYSLYRLATPAQCFRPEQWEKIWRMLS